VTADLLAAVVALTDQEPETNAKGVSIEDVCRLLDVEWWSDCFGDLVRLQDQGLLDAYLDGELTDTGSVDAERDDDIRWRPTAEGRFEVYRR
jgi:hypothetical protein